jgi:hypothetical protein
MKKFLLFLLFFNLIVLSSCSWFKKDNHNDDKYSFKNFSDKFENKNLPIFIDLNSIFFNWPPDSKLDTNFVMRYIEPNKPAFDKYSEYKVNTYIPYAKFNINQNYTAYIYIKTKFRNSYNEMYMMKIFHKNGTYIAGFNLAELSGDCKGLHFKEARIMPGLLIENENIYVIFNKDCTMVQSFTSLGKEEFRIGSSGNIEFLKDINSPTK